MLLLAAAPVLAAEIEVDSTCTLAQAINEANEDTTDVGSCEAGDDVSTTNLTGADKIILTGDVTLSAASPAITTIVTIDGDGHTIEGYSIQGPIIQSAAGSTVTIEDLTVSGGGQRSPVKGALDFNDTTTINRVTVDSSDVVGIVGRGKSATYTLEQVAINDPRGSRAWGAAIAALEGTWTISTLDLEDIVHGVSAIEVGSSARVTIKECAHIRELLPPLKSGSGSFNNSGSGDCPVDLSVPYQQGNSIDRPKDSSEESADCGIYKDWPASALTTPVTGPVERTFTLGQNCDLEVVVYVPHNVKLTISSPAGQRFSIQSGDNNEAFIVSGELILNNVEVLGHTGRINNQFGNLTWYTIYGNAGATILIEDSVIKPRTAGDSVGGLYLDYTKDVQLKRVTFSGFKTPYPSTSYDAGSAVWALANNRKVWITDSTFTNNIDGEGAVSADSNTSAIRFFGTNTFTTNSNDIYDPHNVITGCPGCPPNPAPVVESGSGSSSTEEKSEKSGPPPVNTGAILMQRSGIHVSATYGLTSGANFQRADAVAVADARVIAMGLLDAVDVWGYVEQGVEVCFPQVGGIVFLDAAYAPRVLAPVEAYSQPGFTCAHITRPGTVALVSSEPAPAPEGTTPGQVSTLQACMVSTPYLLRFRDGPGGAPLPYTDPWGRPENGWLPGDVTLTALSRTADWIKVDYYGTQGWVSARHVTKHGACG